jgi:hypothetical protein
MVQHMKIDLSMARMLPRTPPAPPVEHHVLHAIEARMHIKEEVHDFVILHAEM